MEVRQLLEEIAKVLVDNPDEVRVKEIEGTNVTVFELQVAPGDIGKIIGRQGRIADAIRWILTAAGVKNRRRFELEILQPASSLSKAHNSSQRQSL